MIKLRSITTILSLDIVIMINPRLAIRILMLLNSSSSIGSIKLRNIEIITSTPPIYLNLKGNISIDKTTFFLLSRAINNETIDVTIITDIKKAEYIVFGI